MIRALAGIIEWEDSTPDRRRRFVIGWPTRHVMALGSAAFIGGAAILASGGSRGGQTSSTTGVPGTPTIDVIVDDTSTWRVTFSAFNGQGSDTQDSIAVTVLRSGAADTLFHAVSGTQITDTISDNTDLKADTIYRVLGRQKGASGGWSDADTVTVVNNLGGEVFFACQWPTTGTAATTIRECGDNDWSTTDFVNNSNTFEVVAATGLSFPTDNALAVSAAVTASARMWITKAQGYVDSMAVGDTISRRFYFRVALPDSSTETGLHATHDGVTGTNEDHNTSIEQQFGGVADGRWLLHILTGPSGASRVHITPTGGRTLKKDSTYIYRDFVVRDGATTAVYKVQIYNADGSLLYDVDDFATNYGTGTNLSTGVSTTFGATNGVNGYQQFQVGINGIDPGQTGVAYYYGAFAICSGPCSVTYVDGEGGT